MRRPSLPRRAALAATIAIALLAAGCSDADPAEGAVPANAAGAGSAPGAGAGLLRVPAATVVLAGLEFDVAAFELDRTEVDNDAFAAFVEATGYVTEAERIGNSVVFSYDLGAGGEYPFELVEGADWRRPEGPGSDLVGRGDHPVVHVSWRDASAYAQWRGARLPTAPEWMAAASEGASAGKYPWGDELTPDGQHMMNCWQGAFPVEDAGLDGYRGSSPVGEFPPNALGFHDLAGNVWEWTATIEDGGTVGNEGAAAAIGGSFLCRQSAVDGYHACEGYLLGRLEWKPLEDGNNHVGFRCARDLRAR